MAEMEEITAAKSNSFSHYYKGGYNHRDNGIHNTFHQE